MGEKQNPQHGARVRVTLTGKIAETGTDDLGREYIVLRYADNYLVTLTTDGGDARIEYVEPSTGPIQPGDVYIDRSGEPGVAFSDDEGEVRVTFGETARPAREALLRYGPFRLVYRPEPRPEVEP